MGKKPRRQKLRTEFKKRHQGRRRHHDVTREYQQDALDEEALVSHERLTGKGELTRHRTIIGEVADGETDGLQVQFSVDDPNLLHGRVLRVHGLECVVRSEDGREFRCAVRRLLKSLATDQRHVVVAGDWVAFLPVNEQQGLIVSIGPRQGTLSRMSKGRRHVLVSNVDQIIIVASAAQPELKLHLIDRFLVSAEQFRLEPLVVINKIDLVDAAELLPAIGVYAQLGYHVLLTSAERGWAIDDLRERVAGRHSVVTGQSGVGKSSLLNALEPGLHLRVAPVSSDNWKGKHTTTTAELIPMGFGGYLIDTPGIRQFELWDVVAEEVAGLFRDIRPYVNFCRFPDCTHLHEVDCAVREAVADGRIDPRRYDSYAHLVEELSTGQ
ncbi:MAG: ribosome small subunit-dependent GTPase A [Planctomycetota bacterium]|nr:MAG: ribosome small subunit-dependent GTPase A [Planctomycetota bacterium]